MGRKKKEISTEIEDLNLVPIMNLVVCLIPIVLVGATLVKVGVINVNAPKFGMGAATPDETDEKPLNLTVAIGEDGIRLSATGADINTVLGIAVDPTADPAAQGPLVQKKGESYDWPALYTNLVKIKDQFPNETVVNMAADGRIAFKHVVAAMDSMRYRLEKGAYSEMEGFQSAGIKATDGKQELLWPDVVFAVAQ